MNALTNVFFQISVMSKRIARRKIITESTDRMAMVSIAVRPSVRLSLLSVEGCIYNNKHVNNECTLKTLLLKVHYFCTLVRCAG